MALFLVGFYWIPEVLPDHPVRHADKLTHPTDFGEFRNRIGGLFLLLKSYNASYGDLPYGEKRKHYFLRSLPASGLIR